MSIYNIPQPQGQSKFKLGDRVRLNGRTPALLYKLGFAERRRTRIIVRIVYDPQLECSFYYLGTNHHGKANWLASIGFRSYQLVLAIEAKRGRPRLKRKYNRKVNIKVLDSPLPQAEIITSQASQYLDTQSPLNTLKIETQLEVYDGKQSN